MSLSQNKKSYIFPNFKKLTYSDKNLIDRYVSKYPPYSDYILSNLLDWHLINNPTCFSILNENLVVKIADNNGKEIVTSFIGENSIKETVHTLLENDFCLNYIPESVIEKLTSNADSLKIEDDRDSFDYIFDVSVILDIDSPLLKTKNKEIKNFVKKHPEIKSYLIDLGDPNVQRQIIKLYKKWYKHKTLFMNKSSIDCEFNGLRKFMSRSNHFKHFVLGVYLDDELVGFTVHEMLGDKYSLNSYTKGDLSLRGISSYLTYKSAEIAKSFGIKYINHECDMGLQGLRINKIGWRPIKFLKKYRICKL